MSVTFILQRLDYNFICMQQQEQEKIKFLENKVKLLEREISERVRSFLLFTNKSGKAQLRNTTCEQQTQTDIMKRGISIEISCQAEQLSNFLFSEHNLLKESGISIFESDLQSPIVENQNKQEIPGKLVSLFDTDRRQSVEYDLTQQKAPIHINQTPTQQKIKMSQYPKIEQQTEESNELNTYEFYISERKKMRKEIRRLKEQLKYQIEVSTQAKEGLLISEEENYAFRVRIAKLNKQLNQYINRQILIKEQLQEYARMKDSNNQLAEEKLILINRINQFENQNRSKNVRPQQTTQICSFSGDSSEFVENLKDKLYEISQLLPVSGDSCQVSMFRPQTQTQVLDVISKILQYFEQAQKERNEAVEFSFNEKKQFLSCLQQLSSLLDQESKHRIVNKMKGQPQFVTYMNVLKK